MQQDAVYAEIENHYRDNFDRLVKGLSRISNGRHNAQDVVQEAYTRSLKYWNSFNLIQDFNPWFNGILRSCMKDKFKEEKQQGMVYHQEVGSDMHHRPFNRIILNEVVEVIEREPKNISNILSLYFFYEYKTIEIAEILPENHEKIRTIIHSFRKKLRNLFEQRIFE